MMPDRKTIADWRALRGQGMISCVGEYTPDEFWQLLDDYEALRDAAQPVLDWIVQMGFAGPRAAKLAAAIAEPKDNQ